MCCVNLRALCGALGACGEKAPLSLGTQTPGGRRVQPLASTLMGGAPPGLGFSPRCAVRRGVPCLNLGAVPTAACPEALHGGSYTNLSIVLGSLSLAKNHDPQTWPLLGILCQICATLVYYDFGAGKMMAHPVKVLGFDICHPESGKRTSLQRCDTHVPHSQCESECKG